MGGGFWMNRPLSAKITLLFILVNCLTWLILGVLIISNAHPALPDQPVIMGIMAALSFAAAGILYILFLLIYRRNRFGYYLTLAALTITALLTFFDDFGLSDLIVLMVILIPVVLMVKDRTWYLQASNG
jgi:chromate transport protein ChrA